MYLLLAARKRLEPLSVEVTQLYARPVFGFPVVLDSGDKATLWQQRWVNFPVARPEFNVDLCRCASARRATPHVPRDLELIGRPRAA